MMNKIPVKFQIWDTLSDAGISNRFSKYSKPKKPQSVI